MALTLSLREGLQNLNVYKVVLFNHGGYSCCDAGLAGVGPTVGGQAIADEVLRTLKVRRAEPRLTRLGQIKTWVFIVMYSLFCIGIVTYYAGVPQTRAITLLKPTLEQYKEVEKYDPSCSCVSSLSAGSAATVRVPPAVDYRNGNQCASVRYIIQRATDPVTQLVTLPYIGYFDLADERSVIMSLVLKLHLQPMSRICLQLESAVSDAVASIGQTTLGASLLSHETINERLYRVAYTAFHDVLVRADTLQLTLDTIATQNLLAISDAAMGAVATSPENCSCALPYLAGTNASRNVGTSSSPCWYRAPFDLVSARDRHYGCSVTSNVMWFPMDLFTNNALSEAFNVSASAFNITERPRYYDFFFQLMVFPVFDFILGTGESTTALLKPGILDIQFDRYFAACRPASCTYLVTAPITGVEVLVTLFGILGGALTLMFQIVNVVGDFCALRVCRMDVPDEDDAPVFSRRTSRSNTRRYLPGVEVHAARPSQSKAPSKYVASPSAVPLMSPTYSEAVRTAWSDTGSPNGAAGAHVNHPEASTAGLAGNSQGSKPSPRAETGAHAAVTIAPVHAQPGNAHAAAIRVDTAEAVPLGNAADGDPAPVGAQGYSAQPPSTHATQVSSAAILSSSSSYKSVRPGRTVEGARLSASPQHAAQNDGEDNLPGMSEHRE